MEILERFYEKQFFKVTQDIELSNVFFKTLRT